MDLATLKRSLAQIPQPLSELPVHVEACCKFISAWRGNAANGAVLSIPRSYQETAALGFQLASGGVEPGLANVFLESTSQLSGRTYFGTGRVARFEIDGVALLGIALGYRTLSRAKVETEWLSSLLNESIAALSDDPWQASLVRAATVVLSGDSDWTSVDPVLAVSLRAAFNEDSRSTDRSAAWQAVIDGIGETDPVRRAAHQRVFDVCAAALARLPVHGAGVSELIEILEGVSRSMSHWTYETKQRVRHVPPIQWAVEHEYHVQNLLWTILRPIFPDLVDEETLKKLGHTSPRYDLGVPSLHAIVEVKYMRDRGQSQLKKVTDEVAADHSLYLREGTGYTKLIVFIWDEQRQTEEYKTLCDGLESLAGVERVIILPRPARMERSGDD